MRSIQLTHINRTSLIIVEQHVSVLGRSFGKVANHGECKEAILAQCIPHITVFIQYRYLGPFEHL